MDQTAVILFTLVETVITVLAMAWFVFRPERSTDETPSWLMSEDEFGPTAALDRLSVLYSARQDAA